MMPPAEVEIKVDTRKAEAAVAELSAAALQAVADMERLAKLCASFAATLEAAGLPQGAE